MSPTTEALLVLAVVTLLLTHGGRRRGRMRRWLVTVMTNGLLIDEVEVEAETRDEAELIGRDQVLNNIGATAEPIEEEEPLDYRDRDLPDYLDAAYGDREEGDAAEG